MKKHHKIEIIVLIIILIIIALILLWNNGALSKNKVAPLQNETQPSTVATTSTQSVERAEGQSASSSSDATARAGHAMASATATTDGDGTGTYARSTVAYDIKVEYPVGTPGAELVKKAIIADANSFALDAKKHNMEGVGGPSGPFQKVTDYKTYSYNGDISYVVKTYEYTNGANGITVMRTYVFNAEGAELSLGDVVGESTTEKDAFVLDVKNALLNKPADSGIFVTAIRKLTFENLKYNFYLTPEGVTISFSQYAIAPGAAGIIDVTVPYSEIK